MTISCSFCIHVNPEGSKFCNECGSPLRLKPCEACEAVNDLEATHCHQCGAELDAGSERAHELAESVRARESIESPNGADPLAAEAVPVFFDQYLDALRRDLGSRATSANEVSTDTAQTSSSHGGASVVAFAPAAGASLRKPATPLAEADAEKRGQPADRLPQANGGEEAPATGPEPERRTEPPSEVPANSEPRTSPRSSSEPLHPLRVTPIVLPERRTTSPLLYMLGAALLVIGIMGYGYYQYGLPAPAERWLGGFLASPSTSRASSLLTTASRSITRLGDGATPSSPASDSQPENAPTDAAKTASSAPNESSGASVGAPYAKRSVDAMPSPDRNAGEPIPTPAQTAAATSTTAATASAQSIPARATESTPPKQAARAAPKRSQPQRTAAVRPMTATPAPVPARPPAVDTNETSASPLAPVCTKGVAALGLCDPNRQETN